LILQVLLEDDAGIFGGDGVCIVERVQQTAVVIGPVLVVGDDRAIVGVGVVQPILLRESPDGVFCTGVSVVLGLDLYDRKTYEVRPVDPVLESILIRNFVWGI
jgi:hypothetical protein